jgi:hypothetical protein
VIQIKTACAWPLIISETSELGVGWEGGGGGDKGGGGRGQGGEGAWEGDYLPANIPWLICGMGKGV